MAFYQAMMAGMFLNNYRIFAITLIIFSLAGIIFFISTVNQSEEFREGLPNIILYLVGFVSICGMGFLSGFLISSFFNLTWIIPKIIGLSGIVLFLRAINRAALKNIVKVDELGV